MIVREKVSAFSPIFFGGDCLTIAEKEKKWEKEKELLIREQKIEAERAKYKKKLTM